MPVPLEFKITSSTPTTLELVMPNGSRYTMTMIMRVFSIEDTQEINPDGTPKLVVTANITTRTAPVT